MNNLHTPTMFEWLFKPDTMLDKMLRYGVGGFILAALGRDAIKIVAPTSAVSSAVCLAFALLLLIPTVTEKAPADLRIRGPVITLAIAFMWMALLYFLNATSMWSYEWIKMVAPVAFYDAITDLVGTLFFAAAWFMLSSHQSDGPSRNVDRIAAVVLCIFLLICGAWKLVIEVGNKGPNSPEYEAARLILNLCNGAIFLSLYGLVRRLLPPPDPVTHLLIVLYGCAQVAAHGRDCLSHQLCQVPVPQALVALAIGWFLLLGKIAFGTYLCYLYFNGRIGQPHYAAPPELVDDLD